MRRIRTDRMEQLSMKKLDRDCLRVTGSDALRFLQGMLTCDLKRAVQATSDSGLAGGFGWFLTNKGKPVGEIVFVAEGPELFWLSIPAGYGEKVRVALDHYLVADDVELVADNATFANCVYAVPNALASVTTAMLEASVPDAKDRIYRVERHAWGWSVPRGLLGPSHCELWVKDASAMPTGLRDMSVEEFRALRIDAGVAEWGVDYGEEDLILEFPTSLGISFFKGCYIGQEVVARATYRGKTNKSFARFAGEDDLVLGFLYSDKDPEKPVGKLTSVVGTRALGLVRLAALEGDGGLFQKSEGAPVRILKVDLLT